MFKHISRVDVAIVALLSGILLGMTVAIFLRFSLEVKTLDNALHTACGTGSFAEKINVSWFGKSLDVQCSNGQIIHYNLLVLDKLDQQTNRHH